MLLAIDAGNTNVVFALLDGREIRARWRIATDPRRTADEYAVWLHQLLTMDGFAMADIAAVIVATVVPRALHNLQVLAEKYFNGPALIAGQGSVHWGIERPLHDAAVGLRYAHGSAGGMGVEQPVGKHRIKPLGPPDAEPVAEKLGEPFEQRARLRIDGALCEQARHRPIKADGMMGDVDADADDQCIADPLQQDAGNLGTVDQYVIGPFDPRLPGAQRREQGVNGIGGRQRQRMGRRIARADLNEGRGIKIADRTVPGAPHAPPPAGLSSGTQPCSFGRALLRQRQHISVGGAGFLYIMEESQKSDAAAAALA